MNLFIDEYNIAFFSGKKKLRVFFEERSEKSNLSHTRLKESSVECRQQTRTLKI